MHRAPSTFVIHYVELLIQKCIKSQLSFPHPGVQKFKYFLIHIVDYLFIFGNFEELPNFLMVLIFVFVFKVNFQFFLKVFIGFVLFKSPRLNISILIPYCLIGGS